MAELVKLDEITEFAAGTGKVYHVQGRDVAVFHIAGEFYAIDDHCPHRGASLGTGALEGSRLTCPWHHWTFDLKTGECVGRPGRGVQRFSVSVEGTALMLDVGSFEEVDSKQCDDGIHRYLVRYGAMGWVGRFGTIERVDCAHKDRVVVQTDRGIEVGEVLAVPDDEKEGGPFDPDQQPTGELLRRMTVEDERQWAEQRGEPRDLFEMCRRLLDERGLPIEVIDCEQLFDGQTSVLYYLGEPSAELDRVAEDLSGNGSGQVLFQPVIDPPAEPRQGGCGSGGCGSGGCGG